MKKKVIPLKSVAACSVALFCIAPLSLWPLGAQAQSQSAQGSAANAAAQVRCEPRDPKDTRPNDLRTALQQQKCDDASNTSATGRHLTTQEKAQLREQLRQQR